jgi:hypothetical protein
MDIINTGDRVEYIDAKYDKHLRKTVKVPIYGFWDGEKVVCEDNEKTTIRKKEWLRKV